MSVLCQLYVYIHMCTCICIHVYVYIIVKIASIRHMSAGSLHYTTGQLKIYVYFMSVLCIYYTSWQLRVYDLHVSSNCTLYSGTVKNMTYMSAVCIHYTSSQLWVYDSYISALSIHFTAFTITNVSILGCDAVSLDERFWRHEGSYFLRLPVSDPRRTATFLGLLMT